MPKVPKYSFRSLSVASCGREQEHRGITTFEKKSDSTTHFPISQEVNNNNSTFKHPPHLGESAGEDLPVVLADAVGGAIGRGLGVLVAHV